MDSVEKSDLEVRHHLFAIRMNWLRWLMRPIRAIWRFIVFLALYFWSVCVVAWRGMKQAWNPRYALVGAIGATAACLVSLLFQYIAVLSGLYVLSLVGTVLAILPIAWAFGEISALIKYKQDNGAEPTFKEHNWGNGLKVLKYIGIYVGVVVVMAAIQIVLDLIALIPQVGPAVAGITLLPNVASSVVMVFMFILLYYAVMILPTHLLFVEPVEAKEEVPPPPEPEAEAPAEAPAEAEADEQAGEEQAEPGEGEEAAEPAVAAEAPKPPEHPRTLQLKGLFAGQKEMTKSYFKMLAQDGKWLRYILITIPTIILGLLISIPLLLLLGVSLGLSLGIGGGVGVSAIGFIDPMNLLAPGGNPFFILGWGAPVALKIGGFFFVLSLAPILGAAYSLFWANAASSFYELYKEKRD